ncbi:MAG TPA: TadE/TadG family type IV pilus assembly protein [Stellaceae bacterium]|nr:TadE/TadG family type IV pilus assembly protein [Stellaceae bacterium]
MLPLRRETDAAAALARRGLLARLLRDSTAAAAVEFAIIGSMFLLLVCMMIEVDLIMFTQSVLDNATRDAGRLIQTGQVQSAGGAATPFTNQLCNDVGTLIPCGSLQYNVQSAASFSALTTTVASTNGTMTGTGFSPGTSGQDVLIQVGYYRPTIIPWAAKYLYGSRLLISTVAFQND